MHKTLLLCLGGAVFSGACSVSDHASNALNVVPPPPAPSPKYDVNSSRPKDPPLLAVTKPIVGLNSKQRKYLDESIPAELRKVLEHSERFELLGEIDKDESSESDSRSFDPNRLVVIDSTDEKRKILEALYFDASREDPPAICYEPHHAIRAFYQGEEVEIEICFSCSRFVARSGPDKYSGTIVRDGRRLEDLFERIFTAKE